MVITTLRHREIIRRAGWVRRGGSWRNGLFWQELVGGRRGSQISTLRWRRPWGTGSSSEAYPCTAAVHGKGTELLRMLVFGHHEAGVSDSDLTWNDSSVPSQTSSSVPAGADQIPSHPSDVFLFGLQLRMSPTSLHPAQVDQDPKILPCSWWFLIPLVCRQWLELRNWKLKFPPGTVSAHAVPGASKGGKEQRRDSVV